MSNLTPSSDTSAEFELSRLYARRAIVDDLIRALQRYESGPIETVAKKGTKRKAAADQPAWAQVLAS